MLKEFKEFALKGNVLDMAVGVILGGAFGKIVSSLVADVVMPPVGLFLGGVDFSDLVITLRAAAGDAKAVTLNYGRFAMAVLDFLIVAGAMFAMVRAFSLLKRREAAPAATPTTRECPECLSTIPVAARRCGHCTSPVPR